MDVWQIIGDVIEAGRSHAYLFDKLPTGYPFNGNKECIRLKCAGLKPTISLAKRNMTHVSKKWITLLQVI